MLRYLTAGESHGDCLIAIIENFPAGLKINPANINESLKQRQGGFGRGGRMSIETDKVEILSGIRKGVTIGSPITLKIKNKDFKIDTLPSVIFPRPGHADLSGVVKYDRQDVRDILERASARETAIRVACGALCAQLLAQFKIKVLGHVINIGGAETNAVLSAVEIARKIKTSDLRCADKKAEKAMVAVILEAMKRKDTLGGIAEVIATNVPMGLGSHAQWDRKLDAKIAGALMSIQAAKAVEFGLGAKCAVLPGSLVHDELYFEAAKSKKGINGGFYRKTNNAGGIEGGMSNGEDIIVKAVMKPIPTLGAPLASVNLKTKKAHSASTERSDICAVPAFSVVCEAVVAIELASAFLEKFGHDSISEIKRNYLGYLDRISKL